jgi:hypothetical protein
MKIGKFVCLAIIPGICLCGIVRNGNGEDVLSETQERLKDPEVFPVFDIADRAPTPPMGYSTWNAFASEATCDVFATAYVKQGKTLISLASWAKDVTNVTLSIDWKALGLDPAKVTLWAPAVERFQGGGRTWKPTDSISVPPGKGWLLIVRESEGRQ